MWLLLSAWNVKQSCDEQGPQIAQLHGEVFLGEDLPIGLVNAQLLLVVHPAASNTSKAASEDVSGIF